MSCVKGKSRTWGPRKPPWSPKKIRNAQRVAKKASQLDDECRRIQRLRKLARYLEHSLLDGMKSDIQKKCSIFGNFEEETAKLKHNKCQYCCMVRLDLKLLTKKEICKKCAPLKHEKYYLDADALLVWYNDQGVLQYYVPM